LRFGPDLAQRRQAPPSGMPMAIQPDPQIAATRITLLQSRA
jgi:hypothetical protein